VGRLSDGHDVETAMDDAVANINKIITDCLSENKRHGFKLTKIKQGKNSFRYDTRNWKKD